MELLLTVDPSHRAGKRCCQTQKETGRKWTPAVAAHGDRSALRFIVGSGNQGRGAVGLGETDLVQERTCGGGVTATGADCTMGSSCLRESRDSGCAGKTSRGRKFHEGGVGAEKGPKWRGAHLGH